MAPPLAHGSHQHQLQLMGVSDTNGKASSCGACNLPFQSGKLLYGCCYCGYFLHRSCAHLSPRVNHHGSHPKHPLRLSYGPASGTAAFHCNICGESGNGAGFRYCCESCQFTAHCLCLHMPPVRRTTAHQHGLRLSYQPPSKSSTHCDACRDRVHNACYCCSKCIFCLHPGCLNKQLTHSGRKKGYRRGKAKRFIKQFGTGVAVIGAKVAFDTLREEFDGTNDDDDVGDDTEIGDDVSCGPDDYDVDMGTFYDLPTFYGADDYALVQEEASLLQHEHMEWLGGGYGASSSYY